MSIREDLKAFIDDELSPERAAEVQAAIDQDPALREEVLFMRNISGAIQSAAKEPQAAGLEAAVKKVAKPRPTLSYSRLLAYSALGVAGVFVIGLVFFPVFAQSKLAAKKTQNRAQAYQTAQGGLAASPSYGAIPNAEAAKPDYGATPGAAGGWGAESETTAKPGGGVTADQAGDVTVGGLDERARDGATGKSTYGSNLDTTTGAPSESPGRGVDKVEAYKAKSSGVPATGSATYPPPGYADTYRQVIRTANIGLKVKDVGKAMDETETQVMAMGGFVENTDFNEGTDDAHGTMNFQVPEKNFSAMVENLSKTGKVVKNNKTGVDVTGHIADTTGRIRALADEERNLISELQRTKNSTDRWAIRSRLSSVRQEMEGLKEQNKATKDLAAMSRFAVVFEKSGQLDEAQASDWFGQTAQGAGNVLGFFARVFGVGLIYVVFLAPIWLPIAGIVWWVRRRAGANTTESG